jgi:guanylate kinase
MPKVLVLTGPSGAGKSTVIEHLLKKPLFNLSVSHTTRSPRPGEVHGRQYFFTSKEDFEAKIRDGFFLEYTEFNGNYYGTPANRLDDESILVMDIELDGLRFFKDKFPRCFFCLIRIDRKVLEKRLFQRMYKNEQFTEVEFVGRMSTYDSFVEIEQSFDFNMIIDNSKSLGDVAGKIDELADRVIGYYSVK